MDQRRKQRTATERRSILAAGIGTCGLLFALFLAAQVGGPAIRGDQALYLSLAVVAVLGVGARAALAAGRAAPESVLILGNSWLADQLQRELAVTGQAGSHRLPPEVLDPYGAETGAERLKQLILSGEISDVVVTDPNIGIREDLTSLLIECKFHGVKISRAPEFYEGLHKKVWLEALRPEAFVYSEAIHFSPAYLFLKRALDLCCALVVFALTLPLMLLIAAAVKLESPGPVLFRQERVGRFGTPFMLYKFRSMRQDAEKDTGPVWAKENDDRATRVGRFLRRTHLDEVPQIFNVLKNDISFVGPRPERECFTEKLEQEIPYYRLREYIQPGITGWAQVRFSYGDSVEASAEKLRYDLYYAKHASLGFDVEILFQTVVHVMFGRGR